MMSKRFFSMIACLCLCVICGAFGEGELVPVQIGDKFGFANNDMEVVLPAQWDYASYFRASRTAKVGLMQPDGNMLYGLIDTDGKIVVPCEYDRIKEGESELFFGGEDGYYLIFKDTQEIRHGDYYDVQVLLCGYYDIQNDYFCEPIYDDVILWYKNDENIISVVKQDANGSRCFINALTGEQIGAGDYFETFAWHETAALCISWGEREWIQYLDGSRKEIPSDCDIWSDLDHGLFIVKNQNGQYTLMNLKAEIVADWYDLIKVDDYVGFIGYKDNESCIVSCRAGE